MIFGHSRCSTTAADEKRKPGTSSSVTEAPPSTSRASTTVTRNPARAR